MNILTVLVLPPATFDISPLPTAVNCVFRLLTVLVTLPTISELAGPLSAKAGGHICRPFVLEFGNCFVYIACKHIQNLQSEFSRDVLFSNSPVCCPSTSKYRSLRHAPMHTQWPRSCLQCGHQNVQFILSINNTGHFNIRNHCIDGNSFICLRV